jgi:Ca-activated chloride channel homolog
MAAPSVSRGVRGNCITIIAATLVAAGFSLSPHAQFVSGVNLVEVYASVTDERGELVTRLTKEDFEVNENNEPQTVTTFAEGDFPLTAVVGLDRSFSMAGERLAVAKSAARVFLGELRPEDEAAVLAIGSEVETVAPLSTDRRAQFAALAGLDAFGTTGLYDAIVRAIDLTQPGKGRRTLLLLSDGNDRYSTGTAESTLERARRSDVMIYPIALGSSRPALFAELATLTGGRSFHFRNPKELTDTLKGIARELRHQYLLGYAPRRPIIAGGGEWRSISVTVNRPRLRVRARDGYLAR